MHQGEERGGLSSQRRREGVVGEHLGCKYKLINYSNKKKKERTGTAVQPPRIDNTL